MLQILWGKGSDSTIKLFTVEYSTTMITEIWNRPSLPRHFQKSFVQNRLKLKFVIKKTTWNQNMWIEKKHYDVGYAWLADSDGASSKNSAALSFKSIFSVGGARVNSAGSTLMRTQKRKLEMIRMLPCKRNKKLLRKRLFSTESTFCKLWITYFDVIWFI